MILNMIFRLCQFLMFEIYLCNHKKKCGIISFLVALFLNGLSYEDHVHSDLLQILCLNPVTVWSQGH